MTEDDAKTKWCPFTRTTQITEYAGAVAVNRLVERDGRKAAPTVCIASGCMAWRWVHPQHDEEAEGFCGLAGKP